MTEKWREIILFNGLKIKVSNKDGNKRNNCVSNLEWATFKEQKVHAWKNNLIWNVRIGNGTFAKKEMILNE